MIVFLLFIWIGVVGIILIVVFYVYMVCKIEVLLIFLGC